ncbi:hypothetical protein ACYFX5_18030 [Bremerella sp. T1]|uniref:hypothetical protein n=1 Tax=Bremerella sp. TYQ1 TaxID=3119568 RepID=UPI001CC93DF3|nr:hypothetical protein [Bremerella volcania]UBM34956.1 hypothetical protein LA756_19985 [Bremerella volcania]
MSRAICLLLLLPLAWSPATLLAQEALAHEDKPAEASDVQARRFAAFEKTLNNVALIGSFTISGKEDKAPKPERYEIKNVRKLDEGDVWLFNARIKYGDKDVTLPLPLEVKWAGMTPVITLDKTTIPGMGTFSAHVVIDEDKYAGTWTHGEVGGALFGRIEKLDTEANAATPKESP